MVRDGEVMRETEADSLPRPKECVPVAGVVRMLVGTLEREGGNAGGVGELQQPLWMSCYSFKNY